MSEEKTAEAKLVEAEAKLTEQNTKLAELEEKLKNIPNNPEHFDKLKGERDEAKRKLKEFEDKQAEAKGEFEKLANDRLAELEAIKNEKTELEEIAGKWTSYEKSRRETLLSKLTDEKVKKIGEKLTTLEDLEEFVTLHVEEKPNNGNSNYKPKKQDSNDVPLINYKTMK